MAKATRLALHHFPYVSLVVELDGRVETFRTQMLVVAVNSYDLTQVGPVSPKTTFNDGRGGRQAADSRFSRMMRG